MRIGLHELGLRLSCFLPFHGSKLRDDDSRFRDDVTTGRSIESPPQLQFRDSAGILQEAFFTRSPRERCSLFTIALGQMVSRGKVWFHLPGLRVHAVLVFLVFVGACKKSASPPVPPAAQGLPPEVSKDSVLLFTYVEPNGTFATTDNAKKVPEVARQLVRIMGHGKGEPQRRNNLNVEVIDVRELLTRGKARPRVMLREAFETGALALLPPADSCPLAGPHGPPSTDERERTESPGEPPIVILYGTRWCGTGKSARQYLVSNRIPFTSKDIEYDSSAARELEQKAARFGILVDRVPVLDVRGRLLVGYDESRMDGLLADW